MAGQLVESCAPRTRGLLHRAEAADEFFTCCMQRHLRINLQTGCGIDRRKQHVAKFFLHVLLRSNSGAEFGCFFL